MSVKSNLSDGCADDALDNEVYSVVFLIGYIAMCTLYQVDRKICMITLLLLKCNKV